MSSAQEDRDNFANRFLQYREVRNIFFSPRLQKIYGIFLSDIQNLWDQATRLDLILDSTTGFPTWKITRVRGLNEGGMGFTTALTYPVGRCYLRVYRCAGAWGFHITRHTTIADAAVTLETLLRTLTFPMVQRAMLRGADAAVPAFLEKYATLHVSLGSAPLVGPYARGRIPFTEGSSLLDFAVSLDISLGNLGPAVWEIQRDHSLILVYHWHRNRPNGDSAFMCLTKVLNNWVFHLYDFQDLSAVMKALDVMLQFVQ